MHKSRVFGLAILCFLVGTNCAAAPPDLTALDWSANAPHNLAANPPAERVVEAFMSKLLDVPAAISFLRFADLEHSGTLSLVVQACAARDCDTAVIRKTPTGLREYSFSVESGIPTIRDLAGDGKLELIVPTDFTDYQGALHCVAHWPVIYAWTGNGYSDVSRRYPEYYEQRLASLGKEIAGAEEEQAQALRDAAANDGRTRDHQRPQLSMQVARPEAAQSEEKLSNDSPDISYGSVQFGPESSPPPRDRYDWSLLDCDKAEAAKIKRFLGISRDAGMSDAIEWANSENPDDREFAANNLSDIGTPEALEYLQTLTRDPVKWVADISKNELQHALHSPTAYTVEQQSYHDKGDKHPN